VKNTSVACTIRLSRFFKMAVMAGVESAIQVHIDRGDDLAPRTTDALDPA
jgi:RNA polymerase primary sigma factor